MADLMQQAREFLAVAHENAGDPLSAEAVRKGWNPVPAVELAAIAAALRAAPEGWSFQRQEDGSIVVMAERYGAVHVRPDDSDSIAAAVLHRLASDLLAARPQGVR